MKNFMMFFIMYVCIFSFSTTSYAWTVGSVDTEWKLLGANHKVEVQGFTDPDYGNIICHVSQAKTGGVSGSLGLAEDPSNFSINCLKTDNKELEVKDKSSKFKKIFSESTSIVFKSTDIYRSYDQKSSSLVYLAISTKVINGSPKNSVSSVYIGK